MYKVGGYFYVKCPGHPNATNTGYVRRNILVMSEHVGRPLEKNEVVHHIDGTKTNDALENLQLMTRAEHNAHHQTGRPAHPNILKALARRKGVYRVPHTPCKVCGAAYYAKGFCLKCYKNEYAKLHRDQKINWRNMRRKLGLKVT